MADTSSNISSSDRQCVDAGKIKPEMWICSDDDSVWEVRHVELYTKPIGRVKYALIVCNDGFRMDHPINTPIQLADHDEIMHVRDDMRRDSIVDGLTTLASLIRDRIVPGNSIMMHIDVNNQDDIDRVAHELNLDIIDTWQYYEAVWHHPFADTTSVIVTWSYNKDISDTQTGTPHSVDIDDADEMK